MHPARLSVEQLLTQCSLQRTRRSGPGGQHRNKVETAIVIVHEPTGIRAEASERRRQSENRAQALFRLRVRLALGVRQFDPQGVATKPSELWLQRSGGGRIKVNSRHEDFPALLAEALDAIAVAKSDVAAAAQYLGVTSSQLIKLLKLQPEAFVGVNQQRTDHGLSILR
ncbi:MAG: peptide chain release factor-like protein [Pirellulales bacterium]